MAVVEKVLSIRGKKDIVYVYQRYAMVSGQQDTGRPQATVEFLNYLALLPMNDNTRKMLRAASVAAKQIDISTVSDKAVPTNIKIIIGIEESIWHKALEVFKFAFDLAPSRNPQMPFLLKVAGMAYIQYLEEQNEQLFGNPHIISLDEFKKLDVDKKLNEIYRLLLERKL